MLPIEVHPTCGAPLFSLGGSRFFFIACRFGPRWDVFFDGLCFFPPPSCPFMYLHFFFPFPYFSRRFIFLSVNRFFYSLPLALTTRLCQRYFFPRTCIGGVQFVPFFLIFFCRYCTLARHVVSLPSPHPSFKSFGPMPSCSLSVTPLIPPGSFYSFSDEDERLVPIFPPLTRFDPFFPSRLSFISWWGGFGGSIWQFRLSEIFPRTLVSCFPRLFAASSICSSVPPLQRTFSRPPPAEDPISPTCFAYIPPVFCCCWVAHPLRWFRSLQIVLIVCLRDFF